MARVQLKNVEKTFNKNKVLKGINVEVPDGSFMVMVGPSGCGKSTALRCIAGLEEVTGGSIFIGDEDVTSKEPKDRNIAMVFQNYALYPHMNVFDNITYGLKVRGIPADERKRRAEFRRASAPKQQPNPNWAQNYQNRAGERPYRHKCLVCGRTDTEYPDLEFRYCSKCKGYCCYCIDHINNHVHIQ